MSYGGGKSDRNASHCGTVITTEKNEPMTV
jgi:hypothetical protein